MKHLKNHFQPDEEILQHEGTWCPKEYIDSKKYGIVGGIIKDINDKEQNMMI